MQQRGDADLITRNMIVDHRHTDGATNSFWNNLYEFFNAKTQRSQRNERFLILEALNYKNMIELNPLRLGAFALSF